LPKHVPTKLHISSAVLVDVALVAIWRRLQVVPPLNVLAAISDVGVVLEGTTAVQMPGALQLNPRGGLTVGGSLEIFHLVPPSVVDSTTVPVAPSPVAVQLVGIEHEMERFAEGVAAPEATGENECPELIVLTIDQFVLAPE
jgi:hypothetical protein